MTEVKPSDRSVHVRLIEAVACRERESTQVMRLAAGAFSFLLLSHPPSDRYSLHSRAYYLYNKKMVEKEKGRKTTDRCALLVPWIGFYAHVLRERL